MSKSSVRLLLHIIVQTIVLLTPLLMIQGLAGSMMNRVLPRFLLAISIITPFYLLNIFFLIPKLLIKRKYLFYLGALILCFIVINASFGVMSTYIPQPKELFLIPDGGNRLLPFEQHRSVFFHPAIFFPFIMLTALGTGLEVLLDWEKQQRQKEEIEKEKISAELSFLKSQINPHFLFNTLNNIYSLAATQSKDTTKAILLLSDLMRYMLYDSNVDKINLEKEIEFIENYIALQRMRLSSKKNISIDLDIGYDQCGLKIAPMLFVAFVENAIKHGISYKEESVIKISLQVDSKIINFSTINTKLARKGTNNQPKHSGIGLKNVKRRLELLYPDKHELIIKGEGEIFRTHLTVLL